MLSPGPFKINKVECVERLQLQGALHLLQIRGSFTARGCSHSSCCNQAPTPSLIYYSCIANDMGNQAALGTSGEGINMYYCGGLFGRAVIPGSDGYCGPDDGPQCASCARFTKRVPENIAEIAKLRAHNLE